MLDPDLRSSYLDGRDENRRAAELRQSWLGAPRL